MDFTHFQVIDKVQEEKSRSGKQHLVICIIQEQVHLQLGKQYSSILQKEIRFSFNKALCSATSPKFLFYWQDTFDFCVPYWLTAFSDRPLKLASMCFFFLGWGWVFLFVLYGTLHFFAWNIIWFHLPYCFLDAINHPRLSISFEFRLREVFSHFKLETLLNLNAIPSQIGSHLE